MITLISEYFKDDHQKANVLELNGVYMIEYIKDDVVFYKELFDNNTLQYVEDAAENWALGIKKLPED